MKNNKFRITGLPNEGALEDFTNRLNETTFGETAAQTFFENHQPRP